MEVGGAELQLGYDQGTLINRTHRVCTVDDGGFCSRVDGFCTCLFVPWEVDHELSCAFTGSMNRV